MADRTHSSFRSRLKLWAIRAVRLCVRLAFPFLRMRRDEVLIVAYKRKGYGDNLKYITDALLAAGMTHIVWTTNYPETCAEVTAKGIRVVPLGTVGSIFAQMRAHVVIYNDSVPPYIPKRKGQRYINAWHGGMNFKHIGYDWLQNQSATALKRFALANPQPDYYLSGSAFFTQDTAASFRFDPQVFLPWGLPRNDLLFATDAHAAIAAKVRDFYHLDGQVRLALYAPTFRNDMCADAHDLDVAGLQNALAARFGGCWQVLYRGHYFVQGNADVAGAVDASAYCDMQELLVACDVLISDYSSAMWDMAFLCRPVFSYAPDLQAYMDNERAFACPVERWPYAVAQSNAELQQAIARFDEQSFYAAVDVFLQQCGSYEGPDTSQRVAALVADLVGEKV